MKFKLYLRMLLAAVAALFVTTGCSDSDDDTGKGNGGGGKEDIPLTFEIAVSNIEGSTATMSVTPSDQMATYYWNAVKKSVYEGLGSDEAFIEDDLTFLQDDATKNKMTLTAYLQWKTGRGTGEYTLTGLEGKTEYYAYVYGIKTDGTTTSDLVKLLFTSGEGGDDPGPGPNPGEGPEFTIFEVDPGDSKGNDTDTKMTVWIATKEAITSGKIYVNTTAIVNQALGSGLSYEAIIDQFGQDLEADAIEIINSCVGREGYALALTLPGFTPDDWTVICMVSDNKGETVDHKSVILGTGGAGTGEGPDVTLTMRAGDNTGANTDTFCYAVLAAANGDVVSGKMGIWETSLVEDALHDGGTLAEIVSQFGDDLNAQAIEYVNDGGCGWSIKNREPETSYTFIISATNATGTTVASAVAATTATGGSGGDQTSNFTIKVSEITATSARLEVTPNASVSSYWWWYFPAANIEGATDSQLIAAIFKSNDVANQLSTRGEYYIPDNLTPLTKYVVVAFETDGTEANSKGLVREPFTTVQASESTTIEVKNLGKGEMEYWGDAYTLPSNDYANWTIYLADASIDLEKGTGSGDMMILELNTAKNVTTEITPGTYPVMENRYGDSFVPFTTVPGYTVTQAGQVYPAGSWYTKDLTYQNMLTSGSVVVAKDGDNYTFTFELLDKTKNTTVKGTYTGPMTYTDQTVENAPMAPWLDAPRKSFRSVEHRPAYKSVASIDMQTPVTKMRNELIVGEIFKIDISGFNFMKSKVIEVKSAMVTRQSERHAVRNQ